MITIPHILGQHFAYALGRLGALEDQLLKTTDIDRLLGAPSREEAVKMLRDIEFLATPEGNENFQEALNASTALVKENVEKMAPAEKHCIFDILWIEGDRALISYVLKEKHGFTSGIAIPPEPPVTAFSLEEWREKCPACHKEAFSGPREIDDVVSAYVHDFQKCLAKRSGSSLIQAYVQKIIELEHVRSEMRTQETELETIAFEQEGLAQISDLLNEMQTVILGPEALFSYAARALSHIQLLKVLLTGKVNSLPIQEIKSLLPPLA